MVVFRIDDTAVAIPQSKITENTLSEDITGKKITFERKNGEIEITNQDGSKMPFYFEMWFSFSVQHGKDAIVL